MRDLHESRRVAPHAWRAAVLAVAAAASLAAGLAQAQTSPYERGPVPTTAALEANAGPFAVASAKVASPNGYGSATVYYPSGPVQGSFGLVAIMPGFLAGPTLYTWLGQRLASHGFIAVTIGPKSIFDQPEPRAKQIAAALKQVAALSQTSGTPYFGRVDVNRQAAMGHSMGGGGTLAAARDNPQLKAAVPIAPWHTMKDFSSVQVPTMIVACQNESLAPNEEHSQVFYASLSSTLPRAYAEVAGASHLCGVSLEAADKRAVVGKYAIAWVKRFVDEDRRYDPFVRNVVDPKLSAFQFGGF